jgi:TPR repeat protein
MNDKRIRVSRTSGAGLFFVLAISVCQPLYAVDAKTDLPRIQADAQRGIVKKEIELGAAYFSGRGVAQNLELAAQWYERAANAGDPLAQNEIGYFYQVGIGVPRDAGRAAAWYQRSADGGYLKAKVNLGVAYLWGLGVKKDLELGHELIQDAAQNKYGLADAYLGDIYYFGIGVKSDLQQARSWYEKGARLNDTLAKYRFATLLSMGDAPKPALVKALKLFRDSAIEGLVPARFALGLLLVNHPELPAQDGEAVTSLVKASESGYWKSSVILGVLYRDGRLVARDLSKGYYYFRLAELQGGEIAKRNTANDIAILSRQLPNGEVSSADLQAQQWANKHPYTLNYVNTGVDSSTGFPAYAIAAPSEGLHAGNLLPPSQSSECGRC